MKALLTASVLTLALAGGPALAQSTQPADRAQSAQPADRTTTATTNATTATDKMALKGNWRASKLMGLDVYNEQNEKLGDINELLLDKNGKVTAVVIGVGGFLGMGEHDVAVSMDKLKFVEEPVRTSAAAPSRESTAPARETTTTGAATTTTTAPRTTAPATVASANDWTPDHAVMSATKEQLKALPQFKYSDYN